MKLFALLALECAAKGKGKEKPAREISELRAIHDYPYFNKDFNLYSNVTSCEDYLPNRGTPVEVGNSLTSGFIQIGGDGYEYPNNAECWVDVHSGCDNIKATIVDSDLEHGLDYFWFNDGQTGYFTGEFNCSESDCHVVELQDDSFRLHFDTDYSNTDTFSGFRIEWECIESAAAVDEFAPTTAIIKLQDYAEDLLDAVPFPVERIGIKFHWLGKIERNTERIKHRLEKCGSDDLEATTFSVGRYDLSDPVAQIQSVMEQIGDFAERYLSKCKAQPGAQQRRTARWAAGLSKRMKRFL